MDGSSYDRVAILLLTFLALGLRLPGLGGDLWIDEIATLKTFVRLPLCQIISTYAANNHVLYSILAHLSVALFGETERALRFPALLLGVATVPAFYYLARSVTSRREAFAATFLLTVSYHHVYFSQNARGYAGYLFFSILSTAFLVRALSDDRPRHWGGFAFASVANLYIHLNGLFCLAGQAIGAFVLYVLPAAQRGQRQLLRHLCFSLGAVVLLAGTLYAPIMGSIWTFFATADRDVGWPLSFALLRVILRDAVPNRAALVAILPALPVGLVGLVSVARTAPLLLYVTFFPLLLVLGVVVVMGVGTYPRFFLILLPFGILFAVRGLRVVAGWGVERLFGGAVPGVLKSRVFVILVLFAAAGVASGLPRLYTVPKQDYTGALAFVAGKRAPSDLVAAAYVTDTGARFYAPTVLSARTADDLEKILARGAPVWLLGTFLADMRMRAPQLAVLIDTHFREVQRFPGVIGDGTIVVWKSVDPHHLSGGN